MFPFREPIRDLTRQKVQVVRTPVTGFVRAHQRRG